MQHCGIGGVATAGASAAGTATAGVASFAGVSATVAGASATGKYTAEHWAKARDASWEGMKKKYENGEITEEQFNSYQMIRGINDEDWKEIEQDYKNGKISEEEFNAIKQIREMPEDWRTLENGAKGIFYGIGNGVWEGVQWYVGGKLAGWAMKGHKIATSAVRVGADTAFNAFDTPARTVIETLWSDKTFQQAWLEQGGWQSVLVNTGVGLVGSVGGEVFDGVKLNKALKVLNSDEIFDNLDEITTKELKDTLLYAQQTGKIDLLKMDINTKNNVVEAMQEIGLDLSSNKKELNKFFDAVSEMCNSKGYKNLSPEKQKEMVDKIIGKKKEFVINKEDIVGIHNDINNKTKTDYIKYKKDFDPLGLPEDFKFGIELEAYNVKIEGDKLLDGLYEGASAKYIKDQNWHMATANEESLVAEGGAELVSPILHDSMQDWKSISDICEHMKKFPGKYGTEVVADEKCGLHIHFDAECLRQNPERMKNFLRIYAEGEEILYKMCNDIDNPIRKGAINKNFDGLLHTVSSLWRDGMASPTGEKILKKIQNGTLKVSYEDFGKLKSIAGKLKLDERRYSGLNLTNIGNPKKNTIEFRMANGTLDSEVIKQNVLLYGSLMKTAIEATENPQAYEKRLKEFFNTNVTERQKAENFLKLIMDDPEDIQIYMKRWESVKDATVFQKNAKKGFSKNRFQKN